MRVDLVQNYPVVSKSSSGTIYGRAVRSSGNKIPNSNFVQINFTGSKNMNQIAFITPENNALGLPEAAQGGEGVVAMEAPDSLRKYEKMDVRSFMPFWEYNNPKGGYKFLIHKEADFPVGSTLPDTMPAKYFYSAKVGETLQTVASKLGLKTSELSYVIQSKPNGTEPDSLSRYCILEPSTIKGNVTRLSSQVLGATEDIPYVLFKISDKNPSYNKLKGLKNYFVYTPQLARAAKPYSYDCWGNVPFEAEIINSDFMRVLAEVMHSKMNTAEFQDFNPASVWANDRPAHTYANHLANMSASGNTDVNGVIAQTTAHNTGRNYQGVTDDPFKFLAVVGDPADAEALKKNKDFDILEKAHKFGINSEQLSPREKQIAHTILDPYLANFVDGAGTYNIMRTAISGAKINPMNTRTGTVSHEFATEMASENTYDAAKYLTDFYSDIVTHNVLNGSTPANLRLDDPVADFGRGSNGLSRAKSGFKTFKYDGNNIDEIISKRDDNAKWLTGLIEKAETEGPDGLKKLFFNEGQIKDGHNVLGHLSKIKDGEMLIMGWGRPDEQKGFPITLNGFLKFLKRTDVSKEDKLKIKFLVGAGPWNKNDRDYKAIVNAINEIATLDGGIYKNNAMYVDGFFPNRLVGCAHYAMFTSRREMCGITPLEAKAAGVPYAVTRTGGPVDYTNSTNGFLTKEAVELNPQHYGLEWTNSAEEIDNARVNSQSDQISDLIKIMYEEKTSKYEDYVSKCKKNIEEKIDWHNNNEYNGGKSANRMYIEDVFEIDKGWENRNKAPLRRIVGKLGEFREEVESLMKRSNSRSVKRILAVVVGGVAIASGIYMYLSKSGAKNTNLKEEKTAKSQLSKVA